MGAVKRGAWWVAIGDHQDGRVFGSRCSTIVRLPSGLVVNSYESVEQAGLDWEVYRSRAACLAAIKRISAEVLS